MTSFSKSGRWLAAAFFILAWAAPRASAQQPVGPDRNRFLFIVDTGSAMRSSSNGVEQALFELFKSDMKGEFRPGDTIGFWTYDGELHADLPMQIWKEEKRDQIAEAVITMLREQGYHGRARLSKVMPAVKGVVAKSRRLTVVLIYDGDEALSGTPFDNDINSLLKQFGRKFRNEHTPFVVALAAKDGAVVDYSVNSPGSITIPHTALPLPPPETNAPPPPIVEAKPAPPPPPPPPPPHRYTQIVMSGHNVIGGSDTNPPPSAAPPETNQIVVSAATNVAATPAPASATAAQTNVAATAENVTAPPPVAPPPPAPAVSSVTPVTLPAHRQEKILAAAPAPDTSPATNPPAAPVPASHPAPPQIETAPHAPRTAEVVTAPVSAPAPTRDSAEVIALYVIAFSLLTIACALVWFVIRRGKATGSASLITQSMDGPR